MITEDNMRLVFNKYGEVLDITVKKFELDKVIFIPGDVTL